MREFYRAIRKGEAKVEEIWDGKGRNNVTELQERIEALGRERDNALLQLGKLVKEKADKDAYIERFERETRALETDRRLLEERVTALLGNIWGDLLKIRWWQGKKALRVVGLDIRAEPLLANLMSEADKMSLLRGIYADS